MEYLVPKPPNATVAYYVDWSKQLGDTDAISTFTLAVSSGTVVIAQAPQPPQNFGCFIRFMVSGGANGEIADLLCTINSVCGQVMSRTVQLAVLTSAEPVTPSTATKRQILEMMFEECGLSGYTFDATNEEKSSALRRLDVLMAEWRTNSLDLNYNAPVQIGKSDENEESGIPDDALNAVVTSLALRVAPGIGKTMSTESKVALQQAMNAARARYAPKVDRVLAQGTPRGAGMKPYSTWWPYANTGRGGNWGRQ